MKRLPAYAIGLVVVAVGPYLLSRLMEPARVSAQAQTDWEKAAGGKVSFEIASVKQDRDPGDNIHSNMALLGDSNAFTPTGGLFRATDLPLAAYIIFAYKQLTDDERQSVMAQLPKWANIDRYDIEAHASGNPAKEDQFRLMMQALLADRFKLAVHFETKEVPVMALALAKPGKFGPQFRPHAANSPCPLGADNAGKTVDGGFPEVCGKFAFLPPTDPGCVRLGARNLPMAAIATFFASGLFDVDRSIVDKTGLTGTYDIVLEYTPPADVHVGDNFPRDESGPTFLEALKDQLGLKLESTTRPIDTIVIDHIEEPSPN